MATVWVRLLALNYVYSWQTAGSYHSPKPEYWYTPAYSVLAEAWIKRKDRAIHGFSCVYLITLIFVQWFINTHLVDISNQWELYTNTTGLVLCEVIKIFDGETLSLQIWRHCGVSNYFKLCILSVMMMMIMVIWW